MTQLRGTARELSILGVVREILNEVGYERLTVDAVVTRAKASKATIYRKWPDKATLVAAAFDARAEELPPLPLGGETLREDLLAFVGMCVSLAETETLTSFVSVLIAAEEEPVLASAVRDTALAPRRADCDQLVRRAAQRGEIADDASAADLFELVMGKILVRYVLEHRPLDVRQQRSFVDDVLTPALLRRPRPAETPR